MLKINMSMTPEEIFNQQVWEILQDIKEEYLATEKGRPVKYRIPNIVGVGIIPKDRRIKILYKLQEKKAFKIQRNSEGVRIGTGDIFYLIIKPLEFDKVYKKYSSIFLKPDNKVVTPNHGKGNVSVEVFVSDLEAKYLEIQNEKNDSKFYFKIASYGKYLNDQEVLCPVISQLYDESQIQIANFKKAWNDFFGKWRVLAKDLIEIADTNGVKDKGPLQNEIEEVRVFLNEPNPQFNDDKLPNYFHSYREIILRFNKLGKGAVLGKKHLDENNNIKLYLEFNKVEVEWNKFKKSREISTWWAHYQISRLAGGVLGSEEEKNLYYNNNNIVDQLYKYGFEVVSRGIANNLVILKRYRFEEWVTRLHNYLIPRLKKQDEINIENLKIMLKPLLKENKQDKNKFPYKLQAGTRWENFIIKFEDDENILIQVNKFKYNTNYKKMGFIGRGTNPRPSEVWNFFIVLAKREGELTINDHEARDKYKKQKELLAKTLQDYFSIDYDPFYPYRSSLEKRGNSYKIKITLIPPPKNENGKAEVSEVNDDPLGIGEYMKENSPQVYKKNE